MCMCVRAHVRDKTKESVCLCVRVYVSRDLGE